MNKSKRIGTTAESAVVKFLTTHGWPSAERRALHGAQDQGDITGCPGLVWEVKGGEAARAASGDGAEAMIARWQWQTETERRNADADIGVLVVARQGFGPARVGRWWAIVDSHTLARLSTGAAPTNGMPSVTVRLVLNDICLVLDSYGYGSRP